MVDHGVHPAETAVDEESMAILGPHAYIREEHERRPRMSSTDRSEHIRHDVQASVDELGLIVEDITITPAGKRRLVRILVDRDLRNLSASDDTSPVDPLSLDEVADATRVIGAALDDSDAMGAAPYVLEVSSPGVDRPLTKPRHFRRNVGRLVVLSRADGGDLSGRITSAGPDGVSLDPATVKGSQQGPATAPGPVGYDEITRAQVQVEFARATDREEL